MWSRARDATLGRVETAAARERRRLSDALLWAVGVAWLGGLLIGAAMLWLDVAAEIFVAFVSIFVPVQGAGDTSGWLLSVGATAMATCLLSAVGSAWVLAQTPGSNAQPWLVGALSGVLGWAVGTGVVLLALGGPYG
jgi:hypothetical protein